MRQRQLDWPLCNATYCGLTGTGKYGFGLPYTDRLIPHPLEVAPRSAGRSIRSELDHERYERLAVEDHVND
ncbi:hypothetical protein PABG_12485 [Paracoccidioides brasiliensis Pb03]|nr:hypothetical protein PABG_12485 [Paracoccidioides brasiliensis Pb03]